MPKTTTEELALRLRRDADTASSPFYASLMRRAADDIEEFLQHEQFALGRRERKAG